MGDDLPVARASTGEHLDCQLVVVPSVRDAVAGHAGQRYLVQEESKQIEPQRLPEATYLDDPTLRADGRNRLLNRRRGLTSHGLEHDVGASPAGRVP